MPRWMFSSARLFITGDKTLMISRTVSIYAGPGRQLPGTILTSPIPGPESWIESLGKQSGILGPRSLWFRPKCYILSNARLTSGNNKLHCCLMPLIDAVFLDEQQGHMCAPTTPIEKGPLVWLEKVLLARMKNVYLLLEIHQSVTHQLLKDLAWQT